MHVKDKADILNKQYESVFTKEDITNIPKPAGTSYPSMPNIKVKEEGVKSYYRRQIRTKLVVQI
jgi:hypothetical protein